MSNAQQHDVTVENHGSIFLFDLHSEAAQDWWAEHVPEPGMRYCGKEVVEHRYAEDIAEGMQADGLEVQ